MMDRRRFLLTSLAGALAAPLAAQAQQAEKPHRVGFLRNGLPPKTFLDGFRQGLRDAGYVEGQDIVVEFELTDTAAQLPVAAEKLVRRRVEVIVASGTPPVPAASRATRTIPIVFIASIDPIAAGVVVSLARPGRNVTGFTGIHADMMGKRLELLRETVPRLSRLAILGQAANPGNAEYLRQADEAARGLGITVQHLSVEDAPDFERVLAAARSAQAVIQLDDVLFTSYRKQIVELAVKHQLPAMYGFREFVDAGGLMAYGPDWPDLYRRAAGSIDKILKGAKPADIPVEQPTKFEFVINLKTARALGLTIPPSLLARADQVIQ
jgi:putative tryptophan/tyrosine transport system substrate-binding protein